MTNPVWAIIESFKDGEICNLSSIDLDVLAMLVGAEHDNPNFRCILRDAIRSMSSKPSNPAKNITPSYGDYVNAYARQLMK